MNNRVDHRDVLTMLGCPLACIEGHQLSGAGQIVFIVDSGVCQNDFGKHSPRNSHLDCRRAFAAIEVQNSGLRVTRRTNRPRPSSVHGTAMALLANSVAPEATLISASILPSATPLTEDPHARGTGDLLLVLLRIKAVAQRLNRLRPHKGMVVNLSLSLDAFTTKDEWDRLLAEYAHPDYPIVTALRDLEFAGADIVCAAGNSYPDLSTIRRNIGGLNASPNVLTVGAVDTSGNSAKVSRHGPGDPWQTQKPDVVNYSDFSAWKLFITNRYWGTSTATALTSGVIALARECLARKQVRMSPADLRNKIRQTATASNAHSNQTGWGLVDARALINAL